VDHVVVFGGGESFEGIPDAGDVVEPEGEGFGEITEEKAALMRGEQERQGFFALEVEGLDGLEGVAEKRGRGHLVFGADELPVLEPKATKEEKAFDAQDAVALEFTAGMD